MIDLNSCNESDLGLIPGLGDSRREENGYSHHYFFLEISMDRGAWEAVIHGITELDKTE